MVEEVVREGGDITYADMIDPVEEPSDVLKFYEGSTILITGVSGFLGNLLIEKLLRTCSELNKIYVLIRSKKNKDPAQRLEDIFKDRMFERLELEQPKFFEKVSYIFGDCELPKLGLSEDDRKLLTSQIDVVFHAAATVRFDEKLRKAALINVRGTKEMLLLARNMPKLRAFVYFSTAYSHCVRKEIDERFYDMPITGDKILEMTELLTEEQMDILTPNLIGQWPNSYSFTKALAENIVQQYGKGLPVTVVRPSIVISTAREPVKGWVNNYYGAVGIGAGAALGLIRTIHINGNCLADMVPADFSINSAIVAAWHIGTTMIDNPNVEVSPKKEAFDGFKVDNNIPIYNFVSSSENPLTWNRYMELFELYGLKNPSVFCIWYYCLTLNHSKFIHKIYAIFLHLLPAIVFDGCCIIIRKEPRMLKGYKKIHKFSDLISYFGTQNWIFRNKNTQMLWETLNKTDKKLFLFSIKSIEWPEYFNTFVKGGRLYLIKDPLETMPYARKRYRLLKFLHYTVVTVFYLVLFVIFLKVVTALL